jgi:Domain of unknown function (DUF5667)
MTPLFPAQRAAEEFDQVLSGTADDAVAARYAELLEAVGQLRALPEVTPREEFVGDLRSRLMTAAETDLVVASTPALSAVPSLPQERTRRRNRRLGTIAASLVVVGGTAGMAAAASGALPGDTLYPIKRGIEQVTTAAHLSDAGRGQALLDQAATRLDEVRALQAQGSTDPDLVTETMDAFRVAADSGSEKLFASYEASGDGADITSVRDFTAAQMADVAAMAASADTATNDLLVDAADTLADIDEQARGLCASCDPTEPVAPPEALSAGAGAATMANLIARPVSQVRSDVQTIAAARAARIKALQAKAEAQADSIPKLPGATADDGTTFVFAGTSGKPGDPLTSTIASDGKLLPTVQSGAAVTGLVSGLTEPLDSATSGATKVVTQPLGDAVKKVGDTVGDITGTLNP